MRVRPEAGRVTPIACLVPSVLRCLVAKLPLGRKKDLQIHHPLARVTATWSAASINGNFEPQANQHQVRKMCSCKWASGECLNKASDRTSQYCILFSNFSSSEDCSHCHETTLPDPSWTGKPSI